MEFEIPSPLHFILLAELKQSNMKFSKAIQRVFLFFIVSILFFASCKDESTSPATTPTVSTVSPADQATHVARNNSITISFSTAMDPATITSSTILVKQGTAVVPGTVTYTGTTATFMPTNSLLAVTAYTITVTTGAKALNGKAFALNSTTSFTTGGSLDVRNPIVLGAAANYVLLAKTAINNSSTSAITGDLGLSPAATSYVTGLSLTDATGYATSDQVTGKVYAADMVEPTSTNLTTAVNNMITAYNDAAGRTLPDFIELGAGDIGGKTLTPGLYKWTGNVTVPTSIVISGSATDVWIFQIAGNLMLSSAVNVTLTGNAQASNIYWQVAGQVTLGTTSHFEGTLLGMTGITLQTGASIHGRALAQTAIILDSNVVTKN